MSGLLRQIEQSKINRLAQLVRRMSHFRVINHEVRAQNIRDRPGAVKVGHERDLRLAVKQYIPHDNSWPSDEDVTIIGAHANGFPKVRCVLLVRMNRN